MRWGSDNSKLEIHELFYPMVQFWQSPSIMLDGNRLCQQFKLCWSIHWLASSLSKKLRMYFARCSILTNQAILCDVTYSFHGRTYLPSMETRLPSICQITVKKHRHFWSISVHMEMGWLQWMKWFGQWIWEGLCLWTLLIFSLRWEVNSFIIIQVLNLILNWTVMNRRGGGPCCKSFIPRHLPKGFRCCPLWQLYHAVQQGTWLQHEV